ncbi:MAG TPA: hypothetical protein DCR20_10795, partial [Planctomycetaceae bacterium]|nr:hypothetical protein [Planctomycetaceae bacterium]
MRSLPLLLLACTAGCHTISALNSPNLPEQNSLAQPASNTSAQTVSYDAPADAATSTLPPVQTATPQDDPPRRRFEIPAELPGANSARIS